MAKAPPKSNPKYVEFLAERLAVLGEITHRPMMGGYTLYCGGIVFAIVADNQLYFKADKVNKPEFEAAGMKAFKPFADKDMVMSYYSAPPEVFEDDDAVRRFGGSALAAGQRSAAKKPKTPPKKKRSK